MQMFTAAEKIFDVSSACFYPRPKVESAVIKGAFLNKPLVALSSDTFFTQLVKAAFAFRRKMLINNLKKSKLLEGFSDVDLKKALDAAGIDGQRRGETLSVEEFGLLSYILYRQSRETL